jgi:excisionase family DNA binding protein
VRAGTEKPCKLAIAAPAATALGHGVSSDCGKLSTRNSPTGGVVTTPERAQVLWPVGLLSPKQRSRANPRPKAFTEHVRENGASSPDTASLAEGLAELLEQFAVSTAVRVAELVNESRPTAEPRYYNVAEAAEYLRCCRGRIYNLSSQGRLKGRKDGGRLLFTRPHRQNRMNARFPRSAPRVSSSPLPIRASLAAPLPPGA